MKKTVSCIAVISIPVLLIIVFGVLLFSPRTYHIKTEYGDHFTVQYDPLIDDGNEKYCLVDENSDFIFEISSYRGEKDFHIICDTPYFRAYRMLNDTDDVYIIKITEVNKFDCIYNNVEDRELMYAQFRGKLGDRIKSYLLCDEHLIEIAGPYFYHTDYDEMRAVADALNIGEYEKLKEYGLTDEMVKDTESLEKKKALMNQLVEGRLRKY